MRILHLSYAHVSEYTDPEAWLKRLAFFSVMLERTAMFADVKSIHLISYSGVMKQHGVEYHFLKTGKLARLFPIRLHRYIKDLTPDIVVVHGLIFPLQILLLRLQLGHAVKFVVMHHAERPPRYPKKFLHQLADCFIDGYFFNSIELAKEWNVQGLIKEISKVSQVMIGASVFYPVDRSLAKHETKIDGAQVYLWVGHLDRNKDPMTLIEAFQMFADNNPDKKLYMIYQGVSLLNEVRLLVSDVPQIVLVGKVRHDQLLYWYNSADFIISTSFYEGGGTAVCEAMSCGCVPILTKIPSFMMMTGHGKVGLNFEPGDSQQLCQTLERSTRFDLSLERRKVLDHFREELSNEATVDKMMRVFRGLKEFS